MAELDKTISVIESWLKQPVLTSPPINELYDALELLKEQEAKTGHWTISEYEYLDCSCCGNSYYTGCDSTEEAKMRLKNGFYFKYCPYCGAKMEMS